MTLRAKPWIEKLAPYVPGKPPEVLERELGVANAAKLASNENPYGASPRALEALRAAAEKIHRYPDGANFALRAALARRLRIAPEQLVFGCGSDEILELIAKAFLGEGDELVFAWPSFAMYPLVAQGMGARGVRVPLDAQLTHDLPALARACNERTRAVIVCNPNNPTGSSVGAAAFKDFAASLPADLLLVVDEAYFEYARRKDFPDALATVARRPNTIVLRTFSKLYGLAGLRVGYGVCDARVAGLLERARHPFNVNALADAAACAALEDEAHARMVYEQNARGAVWLTRELAALGVRTWPTDANFVLAETGAGSYEALLRRGVIVRPMAGFGLPACTRISIGTPEENERFIKALQSHRAESKNEAARDRQSESESGDAARSESESGATSRSRQVAHAKSEGGEAAHSESDGGARGRRGARSKSEGGVG